jgi:cytoskeletal protein CcmA (bactofilin family)
VGLLTKIFGNRDDPETAASAASEESSPERQTIELEPYELSAGDEPRATSEQSGRVTFAPPASSTSPEPAVPSGAGPSGAGRSLAEGRRKRRRPSGAEGTDEQPHELTRRRIARPTVSTVDVSSSPPPIPVNVPAADDPEEIDVSDQLDEVNDVEPDLDASIDLIIEDDEPSSDEEDEEETSTSVSVWGAAATAPTSSPEATSEPPAAESPAAEPLAAEASPAAPSPEPEGAADGGASISSNTTQPDWTRMLTETKRPKQTLVEAGTEFTGTIKSTCPVVVHGSLDGEIEAPTLSIATTGTIHGNIRAETLRSYGTLAGNVDAGEVYVSGVVRSKTVIRARRLELQLGTSGASGKSQIELTVKTSNTELSALPSSPEASSVAADVPSSVTAIAPGEAAPNEGESPGNAGWDLPEAESGIEPVRARGGKRTSK